MRQLLSITHLDSGIGELSNEDIDLDALLQSVAHDANYEGANHGKSVHCAGRCAAHVTGDRAMLKSGIENIVRNMITHTPPAPTVAVILGLDRENVATISVRDNGPGVPEELIEELFKPFVRGDYARDRRTVGYGIGFAIADAAVKRHTGTILARNISGGGFCVEIRLPVDQEN